MAGNSNISEKDKLRYAELFEKLDSNKDGQLELHELIEGLKKLKGFDDKAVLGHAQEMMSKVDVDKNSNINFMEFMDHMHSHEHNLRIAFHDLDKNKDGHIEPDEVIDALSGLGFSINTAEAKTLIKSLDKDGSLSIDWQEWRDFFQLHPKSDLKDVVSYWRKALMLDIGEGMVIPPDFTQQEKKSGMWWRHLVAGGLAGAISRTCTAPLDRIKIMFQVHGSKGDMSIKNAVQRMLKEGGVQSFWRGNGTNVLKIAPESAIKFTAYEQVKNLVIQDSGKQIGVIERFLAGSTAGAFSQTCIYPLEVIKTRLAVMKKGQYKGIFDCGLQIYRKEGPVALYRGYLPTLLGIIPYAGIDLTIYETLRQRWSSNHADNAEPGVLTLLACGTISSTCGQLASYPLALVRTKLQARATPEEAQGFLSLLTHICKNEGVRGLYRGLAPNFLKALPAVCISYVIYEKTKDALGVH